jgi:hypothetical protein
MPGGDRRGPNGMGPKTGRGAGYCAGFDVPGYANFGRGRGFNRGFSGGGWGRRNMFYATGYRGWQRSGFGRSFRPADFPPPPGYVDPANPQLTEEQELDTLKEQAEYLENTLGGLRKRIEELESQEKSKK